MLETVEQLLFLFGYSRVEAASCKAYKIKIILSVEKVYKIVIFRGENFYSQYLHVIRELECFFL